MRQNKKFLVIKEHAPLRALIEQYLRTMGIQHILHDENGMGALKRLANEEVDFIISDWQMPELDGVELFKKLQQDERWKKIPFLMISSNKEFIEDALAEGIQHHITIPFEKETLCRKIEELLISR